MGINHRSFSHFEHREICSAGGSTATSLLSVPGGGRSGLHTAGSSRWVELAPRTPTHRSLGKKSSFTFVNLLEDTHRLNDTVVNLVEANTWTKAEGK